MSPARQQRQAPLGSRPPRLHTASSSRSESPASLAVQLCQAASDGLSTEVKRLLASGNVNLNAVDPATGLSALMLAAQHGHDHVVVLLIKNAKEEDLFRQNAVGHDALTLAAAAGHAGVVRMLTARASSGNGLAHLQSAASTPVAAPLKVTSVIVEQYAPKGVYQKVLKNEPTGLRSVLVKRQDAGKDVMAEINAFFRDRDIADPALQDRQWTPLMLASHLGHAGIVGILLDIGAQAEKCDARSNNALLCAATNGHAAVVQTLLKAGAAVDQLNDSGWTHLVIHKSRVFHSKGLNCGGGINGALKSDPEGFGAGLAITLSTKEAA